MAIAYILYNPGAGEGIIEKNLSGLKDTITDEIIFCDMTNQDTYDKTLKGIKSEDYLVICGGDGTLNRFVNNSDTQGIENKILYYPVGTGNDFAHDMGKSRGDAPFDVTSVLRDLPTVEVNGKKYKFINAVGYGVDGYCCQEGDRLKMEKKKVDYTAIAIKGLLFHCKPTVAKITVDGKCYTYKNVWIAPTMNGRFYGGGMIPAPRQRRDREDGKLSVMVFRGKSRLVTLMRFPSIFKGEHIKYTKAAFVHEGTEITVEYNRPTALQIDGETFLDVTKYTAYGRK